MQLPLNVSPVSASFFGLERLGILLVLSVACSLLASFFFLPRSSSSSSWLLSNKRGSRDPGSLVAYMCLLAWLESYPSRRTLSLLCFSLALGKIEVILFSCKCAGAPLLRASTTEEWKPVQAAPFLRTHTPSSHVPSTLSCSTWDRTRKVRTP